MADYYQLLGLSQTANKDEVKAAFKQEAGDVLIPRPVRMIPAVIVELPQIFFAQNFELLSVFLSRSQKRVAVV